MIIKAFDIGSYYFKDKVLVPCDKEGNIILGEVIEYKDGLIKDYHSKKRLTELENISVYYKVVSKGEYLNEG